MQGELQQFLTLLATQDGGQRPAGGAFEQLVVPFLIMIAILYFIVLRPQAKERRRHEEMLSALKRGDEVVTSSGMIGTITDMAEGVITLEVSRNVKVRVLRGSIGKKFVEKKEPPAEKKDKEKS